MVKIKKPVEVTVMTRSRVKGELGAEKLQSKVTVGCGGWR